MMSCPICFEEISKKTGQTILSCSHTFHIKCILEWLIKNPSCPCCRETQNLPIFEDTLLNGALRFSLDELREQNEYLRNKAFDDLRKRFLISLLLSVTVTMILIVAEHYYTALYQS